MNHNYSLELLPSEECLGEISQGEKSVATGSVRPVSSVSLLPEHRVVKTLSTLQKRGAQLRQDRFLINL